MKIDIWTPLRVKRSPILFFYGEVGILSLDGWIWNNGNEFLDYTTKIRKALLTNETPSPSVGGEEVALSLT